MYFYISIFYIHKGQSGRGTGHCRLLLAWRVNETSGPTKRNPSCFSFEIPQIKMWYCCLSSFNTSRCFPVTPARTLDHLDRNQTCSAQTGGHCCSQPACCICLNATFERMILFFPSYFHFSVKHNRAGTGGMRQNPARGSFEK